MTAPTPPSLDLRLRSAQSVHDAPPISAFCGRPTLEATSLLSRPTEIGVLAPAVAAASRGAPLIVVFFEHSSAPIPAPARDAEPLGLPDLDAWSLRPTRMGWLAAVPRQPRARLRRRAAWVMAACLPLALPPAAVHAAAPAPSRPDATKVDASSPEPGSEDAPADKPATQRPKSSGPPTIPPLPGERTRDLIPPSEDPPPPPPSTDAVCPEPVVAIPEWMLEGKRPVSVVDAAWEGVVGYDVHLELEGGREIEGTVSAVQPETFTLIHGETGVVRVLQKSSVVRLRVKVPAPLPQRDGVGLLVGGGLLTAVGAPVFVSGAVFLGICPSCVGLHLTMLLTGAGALGGGIPMLVMGTRRRRAYLDARATRLTLQPTGAIGPHGWTGGLRLRF